MTFYEHRGIFQQFNNYFQANLTRKSKLVVFWNTYFFQKNLFTQGDSCQNGKIRWQVQPR